jgi:hydroxyethylthiazole kinase-like uncharacterized protein yjeF
MSAASAGNGQVGRPDLPPLPARQHEGHKGTFGTVCVIGGQALAPRVMIGGPAFAVLGALRAGAGLAVLAVPEPVMKHALVIAPSATGLALPVDRAGAINPSAAAEVIDAWMPRFDCVAIGPGLGADGPQQQVVARLMARDDMPMVIDADALNAMAAMREFHHDLKAHAVLTPHPGEFDRLAGALGIAPLGPAARDQDKRRAAAEQLAQRIGAIVVLKGHGTIISNGLESWRNPTGGAALATAGTGDVLTGVIAGLIAQFGSERAKAAGEVMSLYDCARWGVYLHGLAADRWSAQHGDSGMLATDLLDLIPDVIDAMRK